MSKKKKQKGTVEDMNRADREALQDESQAAIDAMGSELEAVAEEGAGMEAMDAETLLNAKAQTQLQELTEALQAAQTKQEEYLTMAQRVQADFENFRRRNQNVRKEAYDDGARNFATTMLPVLDNMERAIEAAKETADPSLKEGVEMVYRQFCEVFEKHGITCINRLGEPFDPNLENAVMQGAAEDGEPGTVCEVLQKGYQMGASVLRHAMVKVVPEA